MSELNPLKTEALSVTPSLEGGTLRVVVAGAVEMRDPGAVLNPYWSRIDDAVKEHGMERVELDLRDLNFMNSSGILTLVRWIMKAKGHAEGESYQLALIYDHNVTWQRTSIPTLAKLAPGVVVAAERNG